MNEFPRLTWHFEPEKGWMNDPNGLCWFGGKYHAFFQHNPKAPHWDVMHWGHAVTDDLVHWEEQPIALYPDQPYENSFGCFSGSAMEKDGTLYLMYTAVSKEHGQTQCIVTTKDCVHFEKYADNPVIRENPVDPSNQDFRDPKVIPYGDEYRMVCGTGADGVASVLLYRSKDLIHWEYMGPLLQRTDMGPVLECPDLFPLGDKWVLGFSRMDMPRSAQYVVGDFDGQKFTPDSYQKPEIGPSFYAPQTFQDGKGRRIIIGWLVPPYREPQEGMVRNGAFSIPCEVSLRDGKLCFFPVEEAQNLLADADDCVVRQDGMVKVVNNGEVLCQFPEAEIHDVKVLADTRTREVFFNGGEHTCMFYLK